MIMLKFPLKITLNSPRPIFAGNINGKNVRCMLDTGADTPVFCKGLDLFKELSKEWGQVTQFRNSYIRGFGQGVEDTVLWNIDKFTLLDVKGNGITYKHLNIDDRS